MKKIVDIANTFIGVKEKESNSGFYEHFKVFALTGMHPEEFFRTLGWQKGWSWCAFIPKAIWWIYYTHQDTAFAQRLLSYFSPSVGKTYANFKEHPFIELSQSPQVGAIAIWSLYKNGVQQWQGHCGVVVDFTLDTFYTIEGNTNAVGEREGTVVREKTRPYNYHAKKGLVLQGFILPPSVDDNQ